MSRKSVISRASVALGRVVERRSEPVPKVANSKPIGGPTLAKQPPIA